MIATNVHCLKITFVYKNVDFNIQIIERINGKAVQIDGDGHYVSLKHIRGGFESFLEYLNLDVHFIFE